MSRASRGRHALPPPPAPYGALAVAALVVAAVGVAAVWVIDDSMAVRVGVTVIVVLLLVISFVMTRSSHQASVQLWHEAIDRRQQLTLLQRDVATLQAQHIELLLELRALRSELATSQTQAAATLQAATDQSALLQGLLTPKQPAADPVYPSLQLPLVRAAFATQVPTAQPTAPAGPSDAASTSVTSSEGAETPAPRQLLDLTASDIARLRPAN